MANLDITKTELIWPGKYNDDGTLTNTPRVSLPFQIIETVGESRATRETIKAGFQGSLFDAYEGKEGDTFEDGWKNKLIWGDNSLVMGSLIEKFAGKIDLIYIDPPFATGMDFSFTAAIGESGQQLHKDQSVIEEKAYYDTWGRGLPSYLGMMRERLILTKALLSPTGAFYLHCDWHIGHALKLLCDEVFGMDRFGAEIIWKRTTGHSDASGYGSVHDAIFFYSMPEHKTNAVLQEYDPEYLDQYYRYKDGDRLFMSADLSAAGSGPSRQFGEKGMIPPPPGRHWMFDQEGIDRCLSENRIYWTRNGVPRLKKYKDESPGMPASDLWTDVQAIRSWHNQDTGYATQKPESLLERIVAASSDEGGLVADLFCGSGTTLAVAEKLNRRWIGCDLGRWAIHVTRKRLLGINQCRPFEILNLGKYERQYWQGMAFGDSNNQPLTEQSLYEYLAFILKLYGAQPLSGMQSLHGKKGKALIHIGAIDAPVTIEEVNTALAECLSVKQTELHILGWDWEMGLNDLISEIARESGVKLLLLQIPREVMEQQATAKGDISFFQLAYLGAEITCPELLTTQVVLKEFVIPNDELIPEDVRTKIDSWSDYIDYWAVDWNFQSDTFMQGWVAFRTRNERTLTLNSDPHTYDHPGTYRILVKVIDIFGNDTSKIFNVEVQ